VSDNDNRIVLYLDDAAEPLTSFLPPDRFELDTTTLEDGPHILRVVAIDQYGRRGVRRIPFEVRNGPGIAVDGLKENDKVEGKINILINAYGGAYEEKWEPVRAETPSPVPTWAWVALIVIVAWAMYYGVRQWRPPPQFANTPTYGSVPAEAVKKGIALGADLYRTSCASCHQNNGRGVPRLFPPLAGDPVVTADDPAWHIETVLFGKKGGAINRIRYQAEMPAWAEQLSDEEVAAVINHERTSWGNKAPTTTAEAVATIRRRGKR
jgi:mono/diheme cytochrome c family protein